MSESLRTALVQSQQKSVGIGMLLTLFFGGLGMFYVSIIMGILFTIIEIVLVVVAVFTMGIGLLFLLPYHIFTVLVTIFFIRSYNKKLFTKAIEQEDKIAAAK